jgi:6-phosphogluconate dehydrogenase
MAADIGLIGLAVMGENLALNIESRGYSVAVFNRTVDKVERFVAERCQGRQVVGCSSYAEFVASLSRPRKIILMVKAGKPVDAMLAELLPLLEDGDIVLDCGNSHFPDTERRVAECAAHKVRFMGVGVSGGEEGALKGPAIMPGGDKKAYREVEPILTAAAAQVDGLPCCSYIGAGGAGHYVKMVHNGIEYGDMQLICEVYSLLKQLLGLSPVEMADIFAEWNDGVLSSYLIEITADILRQTDEETGLPMVDVILDAAGQKGTGMWTAQSALTLGVSAPTLATAVFSRCISAEKDGRKLAATRLRGPRAKFSGKPERLLSDLHDALYAAKICSYAQGFALIQAAGEEYGWKLKLKDIPHIFRGGCIIRAAFLTDIQAAFKRRGLANLMLSPYFKRALSKAQGGWRRVCQTAVKVGVPVPALTSALAYYDSYRAEVLPANLLQAQRDYFGAHTFERVDKPRGEFFHKQWQ